MKGDGTGETIALIEMDHDPNIQSDSNTFDAKYGLPDPTLTVDQPGGQSDRQRLGDRRVAGRRVGARVAPGASILVVEAAPSNSQTQELQNLLNAVNTARKTAGVVAISMSWGFSEMPDETAYDSYFTTPAGTRESHSSRPAEIAAGSNTRRPRRTFSRSAGPR